METTDSGLIVPNGTIKKKVVKWQGWETEKFQHLAEIFQRYGLQLAVVCSDCQEAQRPPFLSVYAQGRVLVAECGCTEHRLVRRRK